MTGEVEWADGRADAEGLPDGVAVDVRGDVLEGLAHQEGGDAAGELHDLDAPADGASGLAERLSVLARDGPGQLLKVVFEELLVAKQEPGALHRRRSGPGRKGPLGGFDGPGDLIGPAEGGRGDPAPVGGVVDRLEGRDGGGDPFAANEQAAGLKG